MAQLNDANEIMVALRNMLAPPDRIYLVDSSLDVVLAAPPDQMELAARLIEELDVPKKSYRLTYTLTENDAGKQVGVQHFSMVAVTGQRVVVKQGDKVPVVTGSFDKDSSSQQNQFTYIDIGMNFDTTVEPFASGLRLRSKVEESSVAPGLPGPLNQDPVVRQTVLEGTSVIVPGKPLTLGSIDIAGSTRRVDVEVLAEPL